MGTYTSYSQLQKLELIDKARTVLRGEHMESDDLKKLCNELEINDQFAYATEILLRKMEEDEAQKRMISVKEYQKLAKFIYKDHSLPSAFKFEKALQQLYAHLDIDKTENCETLGLAGAVYKRKWQYDHQFRNLIMSRHYYKKGYNNWREFIARYSDDDDDKNVQNDAGFTAINYAYICELITVEKLEEFGKNIGFTKRMLEDMDEATTVRERIIDRFITQESKNTNLPKLKNPTPENHWIISTVAEAYFGLYKYEEAKMFIQLFVDHKKVKPWEVRSFHQQLLSIAYLQCIRKTFYKETKKNKDGEQKDAEKKRDENEENTNNRDAEQCEETWPQRDIDIAKLEKHAAVVNNVGINSCLNQFDGGHTNENNDKDGFQKNQNSKWGLALSGGGFRASLFHIGVLAALAEEDKLKNIEVFSCVSGGSIIGAYYYLKLKLLLEAKTDSQIDKQDYITIVREIETDFLKGVQKNLRMRVYSNLIMNIRMIFSKNYSRTHRMGDLYERHLFKKILQQQSPLNTGEKYEEMIKANKGKIFMSDLFIEPKLNPGEYFSFDNDNWKREHKVPQLILNATSLNTGHNWQFTASWMGEPPGNIQTDIDVKPRLRRMYYKDAPKRFRKFRLGYAVGASSCVPVMFQPMPMFGLYPDIDLQLIDGGLHDNQGIAALIEEECAKMIISDGSGQLPTGKSAINNPASLFYRADSILQERLRELQFKDLKERASTTQINFLLTLHLKNGLQQEPKSWIYCTDPPRAIYDDNKDEYDTDLTKYGVLRTIQTKLSEIRTDLDSFNDMEAYSLMYSGWSQTKMKLNPNCNMDESAHTEIGWKFLGIKKLVTEPELAIGLEAKLSAGKNEAFKLVRLSKTLRITLITLGIIISIPLIYLTCIYWEEPIKIPIYVKTFGWLIIVFILGLFSKLIADIVNFRGYILKKIIYLSLAIFAWLFCLLYLWICNPLFNWIGRFNQKQE